jgi:hypothetical protein
MTTRVVCVKVKDTRPEYQNLREWMANENNVYIGRRGVVFIDGKRFPLVDSMWANPFKHGSRQEVVERYTKHITEKLRNGDITVDQVMSLKGKTLGCWCKPKPCHGDVLVDLIEKIETATLLTEMF